jgi:hypothetical protein
MEGHFATADAKGHNASQRSKQKGGTDGYYNDRDALEPEGDGIRILQL